MFLFWCSISGAFCGFADDWAGELPQPPSHIPFLITTPPSSPFQPHRPRRSKYLNSIAWVYYLIQSFFQEIVLVYWSFAFLCRCAAFCWFIKLSKSSSGECREGAGVSKNRFWRSFHFIKQLALFIKKIKNKTCFWAYFIINSHVATLWPILGHGCESRALSCQGGWKVRIKLSVRRYESL